MPKTFAYTVEEIEEPEFDYGEEGSLEVRRVFLIDWSNHRDFVQKMLGTSASGGIQILPDKLSGDYANLEAAKAVVKGFIGVLQGTANSTAESTNAGKCQVNVTYLPEDRTQNLAEGDRVGDGAIPNPNNPSGQPVIMEYEANHTNEVMVLTNKQVRIGDNNEALPPDKTFILHIPITNHRIVCYDVPELPLGPINSIRGKINDGAFVLPVVGIRLPNESTLFRGCTLNRTYTARNFANRQEPAWTVTYELMEKLITGGHGWNHLLSATGTWVKARLGDGSDAYAKTSFQPLFQF